MRGKCALVKIYRHTYLSVQQNHSGLYAVRDGRSHIWQVPRNRKRTMSRRRCPYQILRPYFVILRPAHRLEQCAAHLLWALRPLLDPLTRIPNSNQTGNSSDGPRSSRRCAKKRRLAGEEGEKAKNPVFQRSGSIHMEGARGREKPPKQPWEYQKQKRAERKQHGEEGGQQDANMG